MEDAVLCGMSRRSSLGDSEQILTREERILGERGAERGRAGSDKARA